MSTQALEVKVAAAGLPQHPIMSVRASDDLRSRMMTDLSKIIADNLKMMGIFPGPDVDLLESIQEYCRLVEENPARTIGKGATGDGLNLWLFVISRVLNPECVVESGVFVGRSLYTLKLACPNAELHAFDISFDSLIFRHPEIQYHEYDWGKSEVRTDRVGLAYFDDHVNNGRRIREAFERGFRHVIFDQCPPLGLCHLYRYPGLPSAVMLGDRRLKDGDVLEWDWEGVTVRYEYSPTHTQGAEDLIEKVHPLPSLAEWTGEVEGPAAYVRLKDSMP